MRRPGWMRNPLRVRYDEGAPVTEAAPETGAPANVQRVGFEYGISPAGLNEYNQGIGGSTQTDRRSLLQELYESYISCPWAWAGVNAIARTITAGGLVTDWDSDSGEGDQEPSKPANVRALERLFAFTNPREDIRQLMRGAITDLLVFGDAYIEVVWMGSQPVALYSLDAPSMYPIADEHGDITKYVQVTDFGQRAEFKPNEVIHISMDAPRSGIFGVAPMQAARLAITAWLHAAATGKEMFRKGLPPALHIDFPAGMQPAEINRWMAQYAQRNVGARNIGTPVPTKNGALVKELQAGKVADVESFLDQKRDEILATLGVPPAMASVIESGNLGSGTGESQRKMFLTNTCQPIAELVLEKINFAIVRQGFRISGWHVKFRDVDMRDSKTIEDIRDTRLRNGSWLLNRYRADIGEPPVDGGDKAVLIDRQNMVLWEDIEQMSKASVAAKGAPAVVAGETPPNGEPLGANPSGQIQPDDEGPTSESARSWMLGYRRRLREALRDLPQLEDA